MLRKTMIALMTVAAVGMVMPGVAMARGGGGGGGHGGGGFGGGHGGGFGGGGFHGGGFGGFHGGGLASNGFHGGGFRGDGFHHGFRGRGLGGFGFYGPYAYDDYDYGYPYYANDDSYYDNGGCYVVQRRVHTKAGWRYHPVQVCG
jgi:hypothetical protein